VGGHRGGQNQHHQPARRFYEINQGTIRIDVAYDLREYSLGHAAHRRGARTCSLFASHRSNITLAKPTSPTRPDREAADLVGAAATSSALPGALDYAVMGAGPRSPVGQRQLIHRARPMVYRPHIIILNEGYLVGRFETEVDSAGH
jgi:ABC-type multidrug transport system fused ATPase/permease subunit